MKIKIQENVKKSTVNGNTGGMALTKQNNENQLRSPYVFLVLACIFIGIGVQLQATVATGEYTVLPFVGQIELHRVS